MTRLFCVAFAIALTVFAPISTIAQDNPMGTTWVLFIENSNYTNFASISGPGQDVSMMKEALSGYQISNILHKKDLTKSAIELLFTKSLPAELKANGVQSLVIWYAGHGKHINEKSYWIPVDAQRDNELSYFDLDFLKSAMQSYGLVHYLVISDACESGPSFYQAMRAMPGERTCGDYAPAKEESAQVFTSSGYDLAIENSRFTKAFATSLKGNSEACIPIDRIVANVTQDVVINNRQRPKFGTISDFGDGSGTFFFMKK